MISDRFFLSSLWVRWLVRTAASAVLVGAVVVWIFPMFVYQIGWLWAGLAVIALCAITSVATTYIQRPIRQRYLDALQGLDRQESLAALEALRTGVVPADPDVLAAAIRTGTLAQAYQRGTSRAQRAAQWWIPVVVIVAAVVEFLASVPLLGGMLIGVAFLSVIQSMTRARRRRRTRENLEVLRAAADSAAIASPYDHEAGIAVVPARRYWQLVAAVAIPVAAFMALIHVVDRTSPDCRIVHAAVKLIYDKRQLADPQNITRSEPDIAAYRAWSQQLRNYAANVSEPRIAPRLHRIADLSDQAVAQVVQARDAHATTPADHRDQQKAFGTTMQALVDEDNAVAAVCFPHHVTPP
ncbi:hypothetical protein H7I87_03045 [Mycobacterium timonense]|uniref:Integral membrane protein n=1 Tax=Mycobacterium bouchedurhonense TaxID=701041 RepID=A0AAW5S8Y8_MYCBC|nr:MULTISPECIES: hypothetical protein [Mycobacterium avium complex (MAC)]MCV6991886.1 hypothetical protein [Mycobacterium bouchedurhonense]MCV6993707.1 hypothetical protein [Mycobacterium timonense]MDV3306913.1 hypothetical protein [Mycobacterium avium subsp. hominissuis]ORA45726.1 hypothetical protein BST19_19680 [Mycobacterium bouchedurhonense]